MHEQLHWYLELNKEAVNAAVGELTSRYPEVPVGEPEGARSIFSTYLHPVLCALELRALIELFGEERARELLSHGRAYRFISREVLRDTPYLGALLSRHRLQV